MLSATASASVKNIVVLILLIGEGVHGFHDVLEYINTCCSEISKDHLLNILEASTEDGAVKTHSLHWGDISMHVVWVLEH